MPAKQESWWEPGRHVYQFGETHTGAEGHTESGGTIPAGSNSLVRLANKPELARHTHDEKGARFVLVGMSRKAPGYHLWACQATAKCPATVIVQCRRQWWMQVPGEEAPACSVC